MAQAGSCRLPIVAAQVRSKARLCRIYGEQSGIGAGFLRILPVSLLVIIPPNLLSSSVILDQ
jgi:hypothetical protein